MIRELFIAAAITGTAVGMAPVAAADPGHYDGDVPGMNYDASLGAPCDNYERFIFGRGPGGQAEAGQSAGCGLLGGGASRSGGGKVSRTTNNAKPTASANSQNCCGATVSPVRSGKMYA